MKKIQKKIPKEGFMNTSSFEHNFARSVVCLLEQQNEELKRLRDLERQLRDGTFCEHDIYVRKCAHCNLTDEMN